MWRIADWYVRVHTPTWLALAGFIGDAAVLQALPVVTGLAIARAPEMLAAPEAFQKRVSAVWDAGPSVLATVDAAAGNAAGHATGARLYAQS